MLEILSDDAMRGVLNCVVQKVLMRTEAGRNLFFVSFWSFFLEGEVVPDVARCESVQLQSTANGAQRSKRVKHGNLLNIQTIFSVFKTGEGGDSVGGRTKYFFL